MVRWLAHAPLIREARVRFSLEAGHLAEVFHNPSGSYRVVISSNGPHRVSSPPILQPLSRYSFVTSPIRFSHITFAVPQ